jgi:CLIP-associating protein 1/2
VDEADGECFCNYCIICPGLLAYEAVRYAKTTEPTNRVEELNVFISALEQGRADVPLLQKLARFCMENPAVDIFSPPLSPISLQPSSPSPFIERSTSFPTLKSQFWTKDKNFDRFFNALIKFLEPTKVGDVIQCCSPEQCSCMIIQSESEIEYGLIVLWEVLEHLASCIESREADIFEVLLKIRYCNQANVSSAKR